MPKTRANSKNINPDALAERILDLIADKEYEEIIDELTELNPLQASVVTMLVVRELQENRRAFSPLVLQKFYGLLKNNMNRI